MITPHDLRVCGFSRLERSCVCWSGRFFERFLYAYGGGVYCLIDGSLVQCVRLGRASARAIGPVCFTDFDLVAFCNGLEWV